MKRLTTYRADGRAAIANNENATPKQKVLKILKVIDRLAAIEDILGDKYNLDRLQELKQADDEGRCVVLPKDRMVYFHEESIDSGEKWVGNWPIKDILLKCGFGIASLTYSIRDVGNKIYFDRNEARPHYGGSRMKKEETQNDIFRWHGFLSGGTKCLLWVKWNW